MQKLTLFSVVAAVLGLGIVPTNPPPPEGVVTQEVAKQSASIVSAIEADWARINAEIETQIARTRELAKQISTALKDKSVLTSASRELARIADVFESIAQRKPQIEAALMERMRKLEALPVNIEAQINNIQQERAKLLGRIETLKAAPSPENEIRLQSTRTLLNDLDVQLTLLMRYREGEAQIDSRLKDGVARIKLFLVAIEENAAVYRSKARTLKLMDEIVDAASLTSQLPELEALSKDIISIWLELDRFIQELAKLAENLIGTAKKTK